MLIALGIVRLALRASLFDAPPIPVSLLIEPEPASPAPEPAPTPPAPRPAPALVRPPAPQPARPERRTVAPSPAPDASNEGAPSPPTAASAPAAVDPHRVYAEGEVDAVAAPVGTVEPRYPSRMQMLGREGTVVLDVVVEADGRVRSTAVRQSGGADFDDATRAAIAKQRFSPARREGRAVPSEVSFRYRFELE